MSEPTVLESERTRLRRLAERGHHDLATVCEILDAGLVCHVGFALDGRPWVFPTAYARAGGHLYLHGASGNFALRTLSSGVEACVTVTMVDGLVLSRSAFHHSINYRSVMLFGRSFEVDDDEEKRRAVLAIVDHIVPGRASDTRPPTDKELRATRVVRFPIVEASAKVRTGGPKEEPEDLALPYWAGVLPLSLQPGTPVPDPDVDPDGVGAVPDYVAGWTLRRASSASAPSASS
ncbi:MAG TPA: pyridoxamine 5'-phosphate oxidase family protein [Acidimicrobiales bacterium]|nr:pyridoxamine 5'-phosphate oxidase family protein [Acidimicrobiales bacterium]